MGQVRDALEHGATAVVGGERIDHRGAFVQPTVLTGVTPAMRFRTGARVLEIVAVLDARPRSRLRCLCEERYL